MLFRSSTTTSSCPPVAAALPAGTIVLLVNVLIRFIHPTPSQLFYPYMIILVDIDPLRIAGRIASGAGGYLWQVVPAVPHGGAFPPGYKEAETVLTKGTPDALLAAIVGNFCTHRNRMVRQIYGQTAAFQDGNALDCPNIQITNHLTFMDWLSPLPGLDHAPRVQVVRARGGGILDTPGGLVYVNTHAVDSPPPFDFFFFFHSH